jgi:hypothetical protein
MSTYNGDEHRGQVNLEALVHRVAKEAAEQAAEDVLERLGIEPDDHRDMQKDMAWLRKYRELSEKVGSRIILTFITILTGAVLTVIWQAITKGTK